MKIGRYNVISELGRGAMGIVYRAADPTIGREVALKVIAISASPEEGTHSPQQMFMREVRAAGRLAHPSIVTIHDAFDDAENQTSCIVMELVPGMTLEKILDSGSPLTTEQIFSLVRQVAEGLDYAHRNQVIHRDLKPANILVTEDGRAKITDFGIAKVLAREGVARTVGVMGTPSYMSPEQVKGSEVDARTDIFSLGIIIFMMLAGRKPFLGNTAAVMFKIVYEEAPAPTSLNPQLTPAHDYVVKKCLAKDRDQRYSSARELLGDLDDLQHGRPPRSQAGAPAPAPAAPRVPAPAPRAEQTLVMPTPGVIKPAAQPPAAPAPPLAPPQPVAAPPSVAPAQTATPVTPPLSGWTLDMPIPDIMKGAPQPPPPRVVSAPRTSTPAPEPHAPPLPAQTLQMRVPNLTAVSPAAPPSPPTGPMPPVSDASTLIGRTLPIQAPPSPRAVPPPSARADSPLMDKTLPMQAPDLSAAPQAAGLQPVSFAPPFQPEAALAPEPAEASGEVLPASKSKLIPAMVGGMAVVVLAAATWGYWKFHQSRTAPPAQVAVQTPPVTAPPVPTQVEPPPPSPAAEEAAPPVTPAPEVVNKPIARKPKQATTPHPATTEPEPPPAQPQPVVVTPPPTPSPEDIAKAEAARLASIPRIIQVICNYGLKEATFVFSIGEKPLFEETLKGKKVKGGFLGIKGSYQGTFTHTITVPAGVPEVSIRVLAKDGATDLTKAIKMPPPGGFVPTLAVDADSDHLSLNWKNSLAAK